MKLINDNLKKAGIFNSIIIVLAIILETIDFFKDGILIKKIITVLIIIGLIFGMFYALSGYKKNNAKQYKIFMSIYAFVSVYDAIFALHFLLIPGTINHLSENMVGFITTITKLVPAFCITTLAFDKNLGKKKSIALVATNLVVVVISLLAEVIAYKDINQFSGIYLSLLILSCIAFVFVEAKYTDKESRGAK